MWEVLAQKFALYGCIGLLIEVWFTGIRSIISGHAKATGITYLWMFPAYGLAGMFLEFVSVNVGWPWYFKAFIYVPVIYTVEFTYGWLLKRLIGSIPWDYGLSKWTPFGLINFKYAPYWFGLALAFDHLSAILGRVVDFLTRTT